jgi:hypothetical protein
VNIATLITVIPLPVFTAIMIQCKLRASASRRCKSMHLDLQCSIMATVTTEVERLPNIEELFLQRAPALQFSDSSRMQRCSTCAMPPAQLPRNLMSTPCTSRQAFVNMPHEHTYILNGCLAIPMTPRAKHLHSHTTAVTTSYMCLRCSIMLFHGVP